MEDPAVVVVVGVVVALAVVGFVVVMVFAGLFGMAAFVGIVEVAAVEAPVVVAVWQVAFGVVFVLEVVAAVFEPVVEEVFVVLVPPLWDY